MALPPPLLPAIVAVTLNWQETTTGQTAQNRLHVSGASLALGDVATRFITAWDANMIGSAVLTAEIQTLTLTRLDQSTASADVPVSGTKWAGAAAGEWSPATSPYVTFTTGFRGQASKGRWYMPFPIETAFANGLLNTGNLSAMQTGWNTFLATLQSQGIPLQVVSYGLEATPTRPELPAKANAVDLVTVRAGLGTQRRRQGRVTNA